MPEVCEIPSCYSHVKIKLGFEDLKTLKQHDWLKKYKLRIDFNRGLSLKDADELSRALQGFDIDFLEDPGFLLEHATVFLR